MQQNFLLILIIFVWSTNNNGVLFVTACELDGEACECISPVTETCMRMSCLKVTFNDKLNLGSIRLNTTNLTSCISLFVSNKNLTGGVIFMSNSSYSSSYVISLIQSVSLNSNRGLSTLRARTFVSMARLGTLFLTSNGLSEAETHSFDGLSHSLRFLFMQLNMLTRVNVGLFDSLNVLEVLRLDINQIGSVQVNSFQGMISLKKLYLSGNKLPAVTAGVFNGLTKLEVKRNFSLFSCKSAQSANKCN